VSKKNEREDLPREMDTTKCIRYKGVQSKKVESDFSGGSITSDAGLLLLRQANQQTKFIEKLSRAMKDERHPSYVEHEQETMLKQRIFGIAHGYEDVNDQQDLRKDPMFQVSVNREPNREKALASPPTICRLENSGTREDAWRMAEVFVEQFIASYPQPPKELTLDFDATDDRIHGQQEQAFFHGYYDDYCYLPLYVFCDDRFLVGYLRPSNIDGAKHAWAILAKLARKLRQAWPGVKIRFRADSGFCRHRMLTWCDQHGIEYVVGIGKNNRLQAEAMSIIKASRAEARLTKKKVRLFGEIRYGAKTWAYERRIVVKAEQLEKGENIRYVVTNMKGSPQRIYDDIYTQRGEDSENRIKEQQLDLFADRTSCHRFLPNQFRLFLAAAAYVLLYHIRRVALRGTELAAARCQTIRLKLLKIGAIILVNTRRILIRMSEHFVYKNLYRLAVQRLT
jgi:hypothetical protein